jgi:hypothetical protein
MKFISLFLLLAFVGCTSPAGPQTDAQRLQSAENTFTTARVAVNILIATGYLAKDDPKMKAAILKVEDEVAADIAEARSFFTAVPPKMVDFNFWLDKGLTWLDTYLTYEAAGEVKHKLSNPTTRPALKRGMFR